MRSRHFLPLALLLPLLATQRADACSGPCDTFDVFTPQLTPSGELLVPSNFGLLKPRENAWELACDGLAGAVWHRARFVENTGRLVVPAATGLWSSPKEGCSWDKSTAPVDQATTTAVVAGQDTLWTIVDDVASRTQSVLRSTDSGDSFVELSSFPEHVIQGQHLVRYRDLIPVEGTDTVYLSGESLYPSQFRIARSDDGGLTWTESAPDVGALGAYDRMKLVAISPHDSATLLGAKRFDSGKADEYYVSNDGGESWGLAFSLDSGQETIGSAWGEEAFMIAGYDLNVLDEPSTFFSLDPRDFSVVERVPDGPGLLCFTVIGGEFYGCGNPATTDMTLGRSADGGVSWETVLEYDDIEWVSACGPEALPGTDESCEAAVDLLCQSYVYGDFCPAPEGVAGAQSAIDDAPEGSGGCHWSSTEPTSPSSIWWTLLALLGLGRFRRRRGS